MTSPSFRESLVEKAQQPSASRQSVWVWLAEKLDFAQSRPQAAPNIIISQLTGREGVYYILKNPVVGTYFRMSDKDFFLWKQMDGTHAVKDLVVAYFMEYKVLAFGRVGILLEGLKSKSFLIEQPVNVYQQVRAQLEHRNLQARLANLGKAFIEKQFPIQGVNRVLTTLYKRGGWLFYSRPAQVLWLLLTAAGLICFSMVMTGSNYGIITVGGSYLLGVISLIFAYLFSIFIHEMAHALTVKHYGREVPRGGLMIYFGLPAFFVDTSDIWMEDKRPRLAVTWAGPYSDLILAGLASLILILWPGFFLNPLLFQLAFITYLAVLLNLNPLLELDGYFLLMDGLEIPMLRSKSLEFIRSGIWAKFKALRKAGKRVHEWFGEFSREERIFAIFGLLAAAWTGYAIIEAVDIWHRRAASLVSSMFLRSGPAGRIAVAVVAGLLVLGLLILLGLFLINLSRRALAWAAHIGLFATQWRKTAWALALVFILGSISFFYPQLTPFLSLEALTLAIYFSWRNARDYSGSRFAPVFWLTSITCLTLWLGETFRLAFVFPWASQVGQGAAWLRNLATLPMVAASLVLLAGTQLKKLSLLEKGELVLGTCVALILMGWMGATQASNGRRTPDIIMAVLGALPFLSLILFLPTSISFLQTSTGPATITLGGGLIALQVSILTGFPTVWAYLLLAAGFVLQQASFRQRVDLSVSRAGEDLISSDHERLKHTFAWTAGGLVRQLLESVGLRQTEYLVGQFNKYARAANWQIQAGLDQVEDTISTTTNLRQFGTTCAAALNLLLDLMDTHMGEKLTIRALQRVYDALPWEEREIAALYLFPDVKRAQALSRQFQTTRQTYRAMLQRIPIFATLSEDEINHLCSCLRTERFSAGKTIIHQGDRGDRFYIVADGSVEIDRCNSQGVSEIINHLGRGDYFGQVALLNDSPRNATCRATVQTRVLSLSRKDFDQLVKICFDLRSKVESSLTRVNLLRQIPIFTEMDARQIQLIAAQLNEEDAQVGATIIRQGDVGNTFYIIESGRLQVSVATESGEQVVAERGPGEYVGEMALLLQTPRNATVRAVLPTHMLTLKKADFDRLIVPQLYASQSLEQEVSRRTLQLRRASQKQTG